MVKEQQWYYLTQSWKVGDKGIYTFPKGVSLRVNMIAWLEFEFAYFEAAVRHFDFYATPTPPLTTIFSML